MSAKKPRRARRVGMQALVLRHALAGKTPKEIASEIDVASDYVRATLRRHGFVRVVTWRPPALPIIEYFEQQQSESLDDLLDKALAG